MKRVDRGQIYKITYPNSKIYIGQDRTDDINYFGSANSAAIAADFSREQRRVFAITKEVLVDLKGTSIQELNQIERAYIALFESNNHLIGYNKTGSGVK